jgi:hypothetical protein
MTGPMRYLGLMGAIFAGNMIGKYIVTPNISGAEQIRESAAIVQEYSGSNPEEALNQTLDTLNTVESENPKYVSELNGLEFTVEAVKEKLATEQDSETKAAAMDELGNLLETYASDHYKDPMYLWVAGAGIALSFAGYGIEAALDSRSERRYIDNEMARLRDNDLWRNHDTR